MNLAEIKTFKVINVGQTPHGYYTWPTITDFTFYENYIIEVNNYYVLIYDKNKNYKFQISFFVASEEMSREEYWEGWFDWLIQTKRIEEVKKEEDFSVQPKISRLLSVE